MAADFGLPVSQPVDLSYDGIDLRKRDCRDLIDQQIERDDPYCVSQPFSNVRTLVTVATR